MKIGIVCPYNILKGGGVQEHVREMQAELKLRGHTVKVITPLPRDTDLINLADTIFVGTSTDFRSPMHTSVQISATVDIEKIDSVLATEKFDIIHFHEPWVPVISRQILMRSESVNIATFHAKVPETMMSRTVVRVVTPYMKSVLKYLHELTAVSESAAEYARSLTDAHITFVPNGINLEKYKLQPKKTKAPTNILYVGRLERRKGVKYLLQAFQQLSMQCPDVVLRIAGSGPDREKLELLAEDLKLKNVEFLGYVSEAEKHKLLAEATLFCSPAIYGESFGIVLLEAMATGLVAVAGDNSGYADLMQGVGALSIVDPHNPREFARRLKLLLEEPELRKLWQDWAAKYVKQFSYVNIVDQYEVLYAEALKRHASSD
ncbi:glycosyltransferase family 4 protein [Candidatus Saccharibacteria bacterium]|nr:glycosyltransferase family 4 protein [Candidatus Saccharibacteria bacterium]